MAYQMTPSERRARAQALKQQRENRSLYSQYAALQKQQEAQQEQERLESVWAENEKKNQNFFVRATSTIGDLAANVLTGAIKGLEGIYDLGAGIVGAVGGIFDKGFQDDVKKHIAHDWTSEKIGNPLQEALKYSYLKEGGIIEGVASGIGQMLPAVAVSVATGGLGAPAAMAQTASLLTLGASAAGNSTEEAFNDDAGYYQGLGYGLVSGGVEIATEKMFGGATKALTGAGLLDGITRSVADTGIKRIAKNALEEGVEEIVSELVNPLAKSIYKGKDALADYGSADYWKGVGQAGIVGSLTALAYSGTVGYGLSKVGVGYVGKEADIADSLSEISSLKEKGTNLQAEGRLDAKNEAKIADTVKRNYQNIESVLKKSSAEKRAKLIEKFSLDKAFNSEGGMSEQLSSWLTETPTAEQASADGGEKPTSELASPKKDYYSFTLRGSEQVIQEDLRKMTEDRRQAYAKQNGVTVEEATQKVADIKVFDGEMSEQSQEHFGKMKKAINSLNKMSGGNISFVVTEANDVFNGTIVDDRTMYIGADTFESDAWAGTLVHEYMHFSEGSQEYDKLFKHLVSDDIQVDDGKGGKVKLWQKAQDSVLAQNYGFTEDALQQIIKKAEGGETLTEQEAKYYDAFKSEVGARMSEYLLGNETFIDKVVAKDSSLAKKFITKIQNLIHAFKRVGAEVRAEMRQLKKAESLYLAAARKAGNQALVRKILKARDDRGESAEVDSGAEVQYNRKSGLIGRTFPTYHESQGGDANTLATRWTHRADIIAGDQTLISFHDSWYLVEKFDDSDSGYQIMEEIAKKDYDKIAEDIKRNGASGRIQSIQRAFTDYAQFDKRRDSARRAESSPRGVQAEHGGENTKILQVDRGESQRGQTQRDGGGNSESRRASKQGVKYSLKEREVSENSLAEIEREHTAARDVERDAQKKLDTIAGLEEHQEKLYSVLHDKTATNAELDAAFKEYATWEKESGYGDAYKAYQEASRRANELSREGESMRDKLSKKLLERKYTAEEVSGFVQKAVRKFHTTPYLNRASYLLTTGSMLDFSDGQGYRVQDHREISDILNLPDYANYSDGMIVFMNMGNIRLQSYGIDIAAMPTDKQVSALRGIISKVMAEYDEFVVDFSRPNGNTDGSITYPEGTSSARIIADIKKYFETGALPEEPSELSKFRYSLKTVPPVQPTSDAWTPTIDTDRALVRFPNLWNVKAEESEVRNPTQIKGTVSTYRKIYDALKKEGFDGRILDASSGLGYGTQAGITDYGFDVDDIEPYPDSKYKPKYTDYSSLDERYDVIISNAVLNVLPQDQRDALVVKMGELLNRGGRLFVNVRGDDVNNLASNPNNVKIGDMEWYVAPTGSYQKGFTRAELVAYLKDALGKNFTVEPTTLFGKSSAIVTKIAEDVRYSLKDSQGNSLTQAQQDFFADSKVRDADGNLLVVYHGTKDGNFFTFQYDKDRQTGTDYGKAFYFTTNLKNAKGYAKDNHKDLRVKEYEARRKELTKRILQETDSAKRKELESQFHDVKIDGKSLMDILSDVEYDTGGEVRSVYLNLENPLIVDAKGEYYYRVYPEYFKQAREQGNDGIIVKNVDDSSHLGVGKSDVYIAFSEEQIKLTSNLNPTDSDDIRYSLKNSEGENLSEGQQKYFADSKVRDREGNLLVVYHGTTSGDFTVFDASYSNVESDMGAGFYFSSSYEDVNSNYEEGGQDLDAKIERLAERIEAEEEIDYDDAKEKARKQLSKESKLFEVYLDIKNPAYVGGNFDSATYLFEDFFDYSDIQEEDFDSEDDYWEARDERVEETIQELVDKVDRILSAEGITGYEGWEQILAPIGAFDGGVTITDLKNALNESEFLWDCCDKNGNMATTELLRAIIEALGYDGIIDNSVVDKWGYNSGRFEYMQGIDEETRHYIVFKPEQIKLTTNLNPTTNEDIRWSLKNDPMERRYSAELSDGQVKKLLANNTKLKTYTKGEAESIVNNIISNYLDFGEKYGVLSGKTRKQAIEMLWRGLNTADPGRQMKVALDIAEYIIQNSVMESVYDDTDSETHIYTVGLLKPYLHSIDLSHIKGEIKYRYGNDNSVYLLWGKRKGARGYGADQIAQILEEQGMRIDAVNDADIFFEIDSAYRAAVAALKSKAKTLLSSAMSSTERKALKQQIAREVLLGFDNNGKPSKLSKIIDQYKEKANVWKKAYYEERSKNKLLNRILDKVQKLKDIKLGTFLNASQFKSDIFKGSIEKLANIKYRGNLNEAGTRKIIKNLSEWYVAENPMLEGIYEDEVADMLRSISEGEGKLDSDDLKTLEKVVDYFKHFIETYNKVYRNGEFVDAQPIAENYVRILRENKGVKVGWFAKLSAMRYFKTFADPMTVARRMDMYESGFYTEMLERLREGAVGASVMEMEMRAPLEEFYKKNKKFLKELSKRTVKYQGQEIPMSQAMLLYMTLNREQALKGLAESGFTYTVDKDTIRLKGFAVGEELTLEELKQRAKAEQDELYKQFSELDKEYISIAEKLFNETCKQAKRETDIKRKGYSNALEDYYVPIRRAFIAHNVDTSTFADEMNRVSNASFNRDTVKGAKNELYIDALDAVLDRHIRAVAQYANLSLAIDEYNKLFNLDLGDNPNKPRSVRTESVDVWREGDEYFKKLISDIQGIPVVKGEGAKFMSYIRGGYAKFQLGANPKVWVTQLSSFAAAGSILDIGSITRGLSIKTNDVDEYCPLAKLRNNDNTVALAQGVLEKVGTVGNALMIPIGKVDRFVVKKLFGACQVQVEKDSGLKIGTEENKVKAGELLKKVILETQQNALATERSAAMRSGNELMKTLTMFTADSMKVIGRVIDSVGELSVLKAKLKATTDAKQIAELNEKIKEASKKTRKAIASLVASAVFMALVAQLFRTLYNRDDDDDNIVVNMTVDAIGNLFGGLPIIKDIYARFTEGYDLDNYAYSAINNLFDSAEGIFNMVGNIISGEWDSKELARNAKNLIFTAGQILGLPTRNVYNIGYGLIKRFSPSTAYKIDDMFYDQKYSSDLNKAIEKDDEEMIATIVGIMLDENVGDITNSTARKELDRLVKAGYGVIPRSVGNSVTYEGEEHALTARQVKDFKTIYSTANEALASLVTLSQYASASDDVKSKAVNFIFDTYYNLALQDFLGVELESKNVLFAEAIDIEKLAIIVAMARALTADLDKKGNAISGTRKAKVQSYINSLKLTAAQKYMIMGYLGYTNTKGETQVKAYINRLKLTKSEKAKLLKYSGYSK